MASTPTDAVIRLRGVRHNNLKGFDLDLPLYRLIVISGLSGSGKSSLAFDTLFAEGQRRYIETFSPYARQFFDRMDKPQVDSIEGIPPAIAIEQRNAVRSTRSTVGTMTEICDYLKVVWPQVARLHCRGCGQPVDKDSPQSIWQSLNPGGETDAGEVLITFDLPLTEKLPLEESLNLITKQGYQRLLVKGEVVRIEEALELLKLSRPGGLSIVQDRVRIADSHRARFIEACEQAYHFGKGRLTVQRLGGGGVVAPSLFSRHFHCAQCDLEYREPTASLFSFNNPVGACPACKGFGRIITIDYNLAVPDRRLSLSGGAVKPWQTGQGAHCQADLKKFCKARGVRMDVPFASLPAEEQRLVIEGDADYGLDEDHQWPRAWYGVKGYFRWLESKAYKMHVRVLLSRYRAYRKCADCEGQRLQPDALLYRLQDGHGAGDDRGLNLAGFYALPLRDALARVEELTASRAKAATNDPLAVALGEVRARLSYLVEMGLGYLTLDRNTRSLSGGETERVNLTTCLGSGLVNTLYVLDEPSVGLHPRDTSRLVRILHRLRDQGNTVVVVEHESAVIRAADQVVDLGPEQGERGGRVVFQGGLKELLRSKESLTGQYLAGGKRMEPPPRRPVKLSERPGGRIGEAGMLRLNDSPQSFGIAPHASPALVLAHATRHNLKDVTVEIPLGRLVCISGVSGSGKTTLVRELLLPLLKARVGSAAPELTGADRTDDQAETDDGDEEPEGLSSAQPTLTGWELLGRVLLVDQSSLGRTPRSNPAVYIGAFDAIREVFAQSETARQRGLTASNFSFNSPQGQCERCRGAGFEKIEMQFLSDVFIRCPDCNGRRYRPHILEVKIDPEPAGEGQASKGGSWSIADMLEATVDDAIAFLTGWSDSRPAQKAAASLQWLQDVGLGYLRLGQPINTLSGGECQRLKLVRHLADSGMNETVGKGSSGSVRSQRSRSPSLRHSSPPPKPTLFLFDEPTTGLHFDDVRVLLAVFQRLVDAGHSVLVIEHNLDVIQAADWVIDLGPDAGDAGGQVVVAGPPEVIADCPTSHTGAALRDQAVSHSEGD